MLSTAFFIRNDFKATLWFFWHLMYPSKFIVPSETPTMQMNMLFRLKLTSDVIVNTNHVRGNR